MPAKAASCEASTSRTRRIETTAAAALQLPQIRRPSCNSCARFTALNSSPALGSPIDPVRSVACRNRHPSHTTVETIYAVLIEHFCKGIIFHGCSLFHILKVQLNPNKLLALKFLLNFVSKLFTFKVLCVRSKSNNYDWFQGSLRELRAVKSSTRTLAVFWSSLSEALPGRCSMAVSMPAARAAAASVNWDNKATKIEGDKSKQLTARHICEKEHVLWIHLQRLGNVCIRLRLLFVTHMGVEISTQMWPQISHNAVSKD